MRCVTYLALPSYNSICINNALTNFDENNWYLLYSPWLTLGPIQFVFFSKIVHETCFKCSVLVKDSLLDLHLEVDFEGVEVLGVEIMT